MIEAFPRAAAFAEVMRGTAGRRQNAKVWRRPAVSVFVRPLLVEKMNPAQQRNGLFHILNGGDQSNQPADENENAPNPSDKGDHTEQRKQEDHKRLIQVEFCTLPVAHDERDNQPDPCEIGYDSGDFFCSYCASFLILT